MLKRLVSNTVLKNTSLTKFSTNFCFSSTYLNNDIDSSKLKITLTDKPKEKLPLDKLLFGRSFTDHMLVVDYEDGEWKAPEIKPYSNFQMDPASLCLHYGLQCFEGMKAYMDSDKNARLFRPMKNMERLNSSMDRICLPKFDSQELCNVLKKFVSVEKDWIPNKRGYSLYLRPTAIATEAVLGVTSSKKARIYVIASPVGPYYPTGFEPVKLYADPQYVRAWPGGTGNYKLGGNYAPGIKSQSTVARKGYQQNLWLFGEQGYVTEVGTMNKFVFWINEEGEKELVTPPLTGELGDLILPGVTRDSIIDLCKEWNEFKVTEKIFTIHDILKANDENRLIEAFGAGTACIVTPVKAIYFKNKEHIIPLDKDDPNAKAGKLTSRIYETILDIQYGVKESDWSEVV